MHDCTLIPLTLCLLCCAPTHSWQALAQGSRVEQQGDQPPCVLRWAGALGAEMEAGEAVGAGEAGMEAGVAAGASEVVAGDGKTLGLQSQWWWLETLHMRVKVKQS